MLITANKALNSKYELKAFACVDAYKGFDKQP